VTEVHSHPYFDPQTLAKLQGLPLRARSIVEGYVSGLHRSPFHGYSIEFAEHREYVPGDDLRFVDWKVFGRTDKYYVKQYEDETNLICYLALDISESMQFRGPESPLSKLEYGQCLAAAIAWLVLQQRDAVALVTFDDQVRSTVAPSNSPAHWNHLLQVLEGVRSTNRTRAGAVFHELAERFSKRGVVVLLSDLFDDLSALTAGFRHLRHQRHDVAMLHLLDQAELELPYERPVLFRGLEQGPQVVADPAPLRRAYQAEMQSFLRRVQGTCQEREIEYRLLRTDLRIDWALRPFLAARMSKVR
jgi:uncharacterized protein (DUF58 family)